MTMDQIVTLLGRPDCPADGVQDYCESLGRALKSRGVESVIVRVHWAHKGWRSALAELWRSSKEWRGRWVVLQYTALAWSSHGFPFGVLWAIAVLRLRGARCGVMYHEPRQQEGSGLIRGACQNWIIQTMYLHLDRAIFSEPLDTIGWIQKNNAKAAFIPIGANISSGGPTLACPDEGAVKTVAIFCLSHPPNVTLEVEDIASVARSALATGLRLRFVFIGRGTEEAEPQLRNAFRDIPAELSILGLVDTKEIGDLLARCDVMLCVRGTLSPRRGSAIAGVACGLPIVGYEGKDTGFPITEAGLELVPYRDRLALADALGHVLRDDRLREDLRLQSQRAHRLYFSWERIAERLVEELGDG